MTPAEYCKKITKGSGSSFYFSFFTLPPNRRRAMVAFYAFCRLADDIVDDDKPIADKKEALSFWKHEIENIDESTHPVAKELAHAVSEFSIPKSYFIELLDGVAKDIQLPIIHTYKELEEYCYGVASVVGLVSLYIFGVPEDARTRQAAIDLGKALQFTNILRDVSEDLDRQRIYLPREEMKKFGISNVDIEKKSMSPNVRRFLGDFASHAQHFYDSAWERFSNEDQKKLLPAIIMATIYQQILDRIKAAKFHIFDRRINLSKFQKFMIAFKMWMKK